MRGYIRMLNLNRACKLPSTGQVITTSRISSRPAVQAAGALGGVKVQRITFTEVTQQAVQQALAAPRSISQELVDAYLGRRSLDYLYGFTLSPLLWRKLPGSKSAGDLHSSPHSCRSHMSAGKSAQSPVHLSCLGQESPAICCPQALG